MSPIGLIRKLGKLIRGGVTPGQVILGCLLGFVIGMIPGFNATLVIAILLVILLNANGAMAGLAFAIGKVLCLLLAPVTFRIGYLVIHSLGLEGLFRAAGETPVVALMDLHYYCLTGGLPLGLLLGAAMGVAMAFLIRGARKGLAAAGQRSQTARKLGQNRFVRLLLRVVFGKQKGAMGQMLQTKGPILRKSGLILCGVLVLLVAAIQFLLVDLFLRDALRYGMEAAVGAEVDIDKADLSLLGGRLSVQGLQVTDPDKPTHNLFRAGSLAGDISLAGLLTRRVVIDELTVADAATDSPRQTPGKVHKPAPRPEPKPPDDALSEYFEKAKQLREYFQKLKEYLDRRDANQPEPTPQDRQREKQRLRDQAEAQGYFRLSARGLLARRPSWVIRKLEVQHLRVEHVEGPLRVQGKELSDAPQVHDRPMELTVTEGGKTLAGVRFDFTPPGGEHRLALHTPPLPLGEVFRLSAKSGIDVSGGTGRIDVEDGLFTNQQFKHFPFQVVVRDLKAGAKAGRGVLGLDPKASQEAMKHLTSMTFAGSLTGSLGAPRLALDEKGMLSGLRDTLVSAGKAELARQADQQLQKLGAKLTGTVGGEVGKTLEGAAGGLLKGLPGLGAKKPPDANQPKDPNDAKKPKGGLFDGLLK